MADALIKNLNIESSKLSYVMACESMWRNNNNKIQFPHPFVQSESTHTFIEQPQLYNFFQNPKNFSYEEFPCKYVWNKSEHTWKKRNPSSHDGSQRIVLPNFGEMYYLSLLIDNVKGTSNYEDFLTINGKVYKTFKESCFAHGLLEGDEDWHNAMAEAVHHGQILIIYASFFNVVRAYCEVSSLLKLWNAFWKYLSEDMVKEHKKLLNFEENDLTDADFVYYTLIEIELLLLNYNPSLSVC